MNSEIHLQPEERKQSVLGIIVRALLWLAAIGFICYAGLIGFIVLAMAQVHGGGTGGVIVFFLVIVAIGATAALVIPAIQTARRKRHIEHR